MSADLDRYLDGFGLQLKHAQRPRRRRRALTAAVASLAVAALLVLVALPGTPAHRDLDAVAQARAALSAHGELVYLRITSRTTGVGVRIGVQPRGPNVTEQWVASNPPRWRYTQFFQRPATGKQVREQFSYSKGTQSFYSSAAKRLTRRTGLSDRGQAAKTPGPLGGDPQTDLRSLLASGDVTDAGLRTTDGRSVRRLVARQQRRGRLSMTLTYDVDSSTFAPVGGSLVFHGLPGQPRSAAVTTTFVVDAYRRLPLTPKTQKLLDIPIPPGTQVITIPAHRNESGKCRVSPDGKKRVCPVTP